VRLEELKTTPISKISSLVIDPIKTAKANEKIEVALPNIKMEPTGSYKGVVVDDNNSLVGVVTGSDIVDRALLKAIDPKVGTVSQVANPNPVKAKLSDTVDSVVSLFSTTSVPFIVITDDDGKPQGIIDRQKFARVVRDLLT